MTKWRDTTLLRQRVISGGFRNVYRYVGRARVDHW